MKSIDPTIMMNIQISLKTNKWFNELGKQDIISIPPKLEDLAHKLSDCDRIILFKLLEEFVFIDPRKLSELYSIALDKVGKSIYKMYEEIYIVPANIEDIHGKSSDSAQYAIYGMLEERIGEYDIRIPFYRQRFRMSILDLHRNGTEKTLVLLVDDYVGSGATLEKALNILNKSGLFKGKVICLAGIGMKKGIENIESYQIQIYTGAIMKKCISDSGLFENVDSVRNKMISLGTKLENSEYALGYAQSESIVRLIRTPDNTLPMFWSSGKDQEKWPAPFPRI